MGKVDFYPIIRRRRRRNFLSFLPHEVNFRTASDPAKRRCCRKCGHVGGGGRPPLSRRTHPSCRRIAVGTPLEHGCRTRLRFHFDSDFRFDLSIDEIADNC